MDKKLKIIIPAIIACLLWGSAAPIAKIGFDYAPPIFLSGMRFMLAGLLLIPVLLLKKIPIRFNSQQLRLMLLFAFVQTFLQYGLFFIGLSLVPAPIAAILIGASPLFIAIMSHIAFKTDKITARKAIAIVLGLSGVVFISIAKGNILSVDNPYFYLGVILLIFSNILGGYTNIIIAKRNIEINPILLTSFANFTGGIVLLLVGLFVEKPNVDFGDWHLYPILLWLSIISAASFSIWYTQLQKPEVKVSELNMWKFLIPITGCLLSWLIIEGESPDWMSVVGIIIICMALQILQLPAQTLAKISRFLGFKINSKR